MDFCKRSTLVKADEPPFPVASHPGVGKSHKTSAKARITRLAAKGGKAAHVTGITDHSAMDLARFPLKRFPQPLPACMKVDVVDKVLFAHAPGELFVEDIALLVEEFPERFEIPGIESLCPGSKNRIEISRRSRHRVLLVVAAS